MTQDVMLLEPYATNNIENLANYDFHKLINHISEILQLGQVFPSFEANGIFGQMCPTHKRTASVGRNAR